MNTSLVPSNVSSTLQTKVDSATKRKFNEQIKMYGKENEITTEPLALTQTPQKQTKEKKRKVLSQCSRGDVNSTPPTSTIRRSTKQVGGIMSNIKKKGGKLIRTLTPPRHLNVGVKTPLRKKNFDHPQFDNTDANSLSSDDTIRKDNLTKHKLTLSSKFDNAHQFELRTSESDPSPFQLEIPSHDDVLVHCKICCIMENYFDIGGINFDFSTLMPWVINSNHEASNIDLLSVNSHDDLPRRSRNVQRDTSNNVQNDKVKHVLSRLQDIVDDIVVEGFFREYYEDDNREGGLGRVEACVFSSNKLRRFIICYRCSSDVQDCPLLGTQSRRNNEKNEKMSSRLPSQKAKQSEREKRSKHYQDGVHNDNIAPNKREQNPIHVDVNQSFLLPFHLSTLQENMSTLLDRLTTLKPFFDLAVTGHSFGGALATLASKSYAACYPASRVYCNVFGCPTVGGTAFRREVHSLPNLNLIRVERSTDPFVNLPQKYATVQNTNQNNPNTNGHINRIDWVHVGHSLRLASANTFGVSEEAKRPVDVHFYRYDKHRPSSNFFKAKLLCVNNLTKLKIGNEIMSYRKDLEKIKALNLKWVDSFDGETVNDISTSGIFA